MRNWMTPAISWVRPPNISATPNTTGVIAAGMSLALIMLSMNVVTAKAARPSGAEFPRHRLADLLVWLLAAQLVALARRWYSSDSSSNRELFHGRMNR